MTGPWAILCCGCNRLMSKTGEPLGPRQPGSVNLAELFGGFADSEDVASYQTKEAGDAAAVEAGWSAIDGNHRCQECTAGLSATIRSASGAHGAYIPWPFPADETYPAQAASPEAE